MTTTFSRQFSVRGKSLMAFGVVSVSMGASALNSVIGGARIHEKTRTSIDISSAGVRDSLSMAEAATRMRTRDYRVSITMPDELPTAMAKSQKSKDEFEKYRKSYADAIADDKERASYEQAMRDWADYVKVSDEGVAIAQTGSS
ncbi:hypothetical protein OY671_010793, partial [Metschnikowia pulcherrima]